MTEKLFELEKQLDNFGVKTNLDQNTLLLFPENFREIHSYKLFGDNLLAIPAGENDEMEKPFSFLSSKQTLELFDSEFRTEQMNDFIQIGNVFGSTEIVLLNKARNTVHIFHISDICDKDWLTYKLETEICELEVFIQNLRPQTVCCFANRKSYSEYNVFEIRDNFKLLNDGNITEYSEEKTVWEAYHKLVDESVDKGFEVHYAPRKILERLG
ncbi:hypothetical protein [Flavobacterium sp. FPG59]|jgi:hypothetical protein|uniref:hypothetical protein n=1 Tax=Flavobacterium sp. FPG59 TaxID=1929267 RepID=UPI000A3C56AD|nr:hypothetical protein [Flavobacterium sp. FPG59]OUD31749.1 hypothetical protein FPG59_14915 [Flavobacterium sp. FPG59]